jgi:hypothetical protein
MNTPKPVTPVEAKIVWATLRNPSARRVAKALSQAGRRVHHSTIARWRAQGWRSVVHGPHPVEAARQAIDVAARVLTGDPTAGPEVLQRQAEEREKLASLPDHELLHRAARELCITNILVSQELQCHLSILVAEKTIETGVLLRALSGAVDAAAAAFGEVLEIRDAKPGSKDDSDDAFLAEARKVLEDALKH